MTAFPAQTVRDALDQGGELVAVRGVLPDGFTDLTDDSRRVLGGALFVAIRGTERDGHDFLDAARAAGASAAIVEEGQGVALPSYVVRNGRRAAALAAAAAFQHPERDLMIAGVTGTNGKTTTVGILRHLLDDDQTPAASIGTLGVRLGSAGDLLPGTSGLTTPGVIDLYRTLRRLVDGGVRRVAMEVSSHSLDQRRVEGIPIQAAIFTNVTRDHLDYHGTMEAYIRAKARLIAHLAPDGVAVINAGEPAWEQLPPAGRRVTFAVNGAADVTATGVRCLPDGSRWTLTAGAYHADIVLPLIGEYNVANAVGAAACAWALGVGFDRIAERLATTPQVPGRLERLWEHPAVLRDYAHTPDALERALGALRPFTRGRLIVVFGCGGDRDRGKRPLMGGVAATMADVAIVTSDNPRTEDPERILDDIEVGMGGASHERIEDRRAAIARAMQMAGEGDVVLLAGKGHETYQIRGTTSFPFDERVVVAELGGAAPVSSR